MAPNKRKVEGDGGSDGSDNDHGGDSDADYNSGCGSYNYGGASGDNEMRHNSSSQIVGEERRKDKKLKKKKDLESWKGIADLYSLCSTII